MSNQIKRIMLVDDNKVDNFFHTRIIKKYDDTIELIIKESAYDAIHYLTNSNKALLPNIIFLDINMPGMNGWEFIEHYKTLDESLQKSMIVVMLSTSENPDDEALAATHDLLADFKSKPLTHSMLDDVFATYYLKCRI